MPPRKKAATAPTPKASTPELEHIDGCESPRTESWLTRGLAVVRCQECGAREIK